MDELIPVLGILFAVGVPSVALATHFVLRPLVRDIIGAIRSSQTSGDDDVRARLARLEQDYQLLDQQVNRLLEAERFRRELESGSSE